MTGPMIVHSPLVRPTLAFRRSSAPADAEPVPAAPAHAGEALQVGSDRPLGLPLMGGDASLGFGDPLLQFGDRALRLAARAADFAGPEPGNFQRPHGVAVLLELDPVPGDVAVAVGDHVAATALDRSKLLGTSISTSSVDTVLPLSILTMTFSGSSTTCRDTTVRISDRSSASRSGWPRKPRSCASRICNRSRATGAEAVRLPKSRRRSIMPPSFAATGPSGLFARSEPSSRPSRPIDGARRRYRRAPARSRHCSG